MFILIFEFIVILYFHCYFHVYFNLHFCLPSRFICIAMFTFILSLCLLSFYFYYRLFDQYFHFHFYLHCSFICISLVILILMIIFKFTLIIPFILIFTLLPLYFYPDHHMIFMSIFISAFIFILILFYSYLPCLFPFSFCCYSLFLCSIYSYCYSYFYY